MSKNINSAVIDITFNEENPLTNLLKNSLKDRCNMDDVVNVFATNNNIMIVIHDIKGKNKKLFDEVSNIEAASTITIKKFNETIEDDAEEYNGGCLDAHILMKIMSRRTIPSGKRKRLDEVIRLRNQVSTYLEKEKDDYIDDDIKLTWCDETKTFRLSSIDHSLIKRLYTIITSKFIVDQVDSMVIHDNVLVITVNPFFVDSFRDDLKTILDDVKGHGGYNAYKEINQFPGVQIYESFYNKKSLVHLTVNGELYIFCSDDIGYINALMFWLGGNNDLFDNLKTSGVPTCESHKYSSSIWIKAKSMAHATKIYNYIKGDSING